METNERNQPPSFSGEMTDYERRMAPLQRRRLEEIALGLRFRERNQSVMCVYDSLSRGGGRGMERGREGEGEREGGEGREREGGGREGRERDRGREREGGRERERGREREDRKQGENRERTHHLCFCKMTPGILPQPEKITQRGSCSAGTETADRVKPHQAGHTCPAATPAL